MTSLGIRLPADEKEALAAIAKQQGTTISHIVRQLIKGTMANEPLSLQPLLNGGQVQ